MFLYIFRLLIKRHWKALMLTVITLFIQIFINNINELIVIQTLRDVVMFILPIQETLFYQIFRFEIFDDFGSIASIFFNMYIVQYWQISSCVMKAMLCRIYNRARLFYVFIVSIYSNFINNLLFFELVWFSFTLFVLCIKFQLLIKYINQMHLLI